MRAILFDLDGTLLDIDLQRFLSRYFDALGAMTASRFPGHEVVPAILTSTDAMQQSHPGSTNREAFDAAFLTRTGIDLGEHWEVFERFYADTFPKLRDDSGPRAGARRAVATAKALGLEVVVATQPIFPRVAVEHRLAWAGLADLRLDVLTTYENMHACKPDAAFFREASALVGCVPAECMMVGDDRSMDMPASDAGMRTFYAGRDDGVSADWSGSLDDLADLLPRLVSRPA